MTTFAQLMHRTRSARGLTFAQLAAEVGYHPSYLSLVERGLRLLDEEGVVRLAQVLGLDPAVALLAALRERLPEDLRILVPSELPEPTHDNLHASARQLQAEHFDFDVQEIRTETTVDWEGNGRNIRTYEGCRPNAAGRPIWELSFRERVGGKPSQGEPSHSKFAVRSQPADLECELTTTTSDFWRTNRLFFPKGWRRSPHPSEDSFSFTIETYIEQAYSLDPATIAKRVASEGMHPFRGRFSYYLPFFTGRLKIGFDMPKGYIPEKWEAWCWWGTQTLESTSRNLAGKGASRSFELRSEGGHAELSVIEPLAGYSYALIWTPADRQHYLEARFGGPDESQAKPTAASAPRPAPSRARRS